MQNFDAQRVAESRRTFKHDCRGRTLCRWLVLALLILGPALHAEEEPAGRTASGPGSSMEEVLVVGEHPGPGVWKVRRASHTLFILGTHTPLPKGLVWRSKEVESAIGQSSEILGAYSVSLRIGQGATLQSRSGKLQDVLPKRMSAQWRLLRDQYIAESDEADKLLPAAAALLLQARAYERSGLTYSEDVWAQIYQLAARYGVPVWQQNYETRPVAGEWSRSSRGRTNGVKYLAETMDRLDSDIRDARARANAWAIGDLAVLKTLVENDASYARSLAYSWPFLKEDEVRRLQADAENKLLAAIERVMNRNKVAFAALPIHMLLDKDGVLARLRVAGYLVETPR